MASEAGQAWSCVAFGSVSFRALPNLSLASATESRPRPVSPRLRPFPCRFQKGRSATVRREGRLRIV